MKRVCFLALTLMGLNLQAQTKILFDATKAESSGNADWVIDADSHNLGYPSGPAVSGAGSESNPQRIPTPVQSTITAATSENYWNGALSYWAIDCVKQGYVVETLPYNGQITYGVASNAQDLSNYKVFVIDEPNIMFTDAEKTAIINFVQHGGGLCIISDHTISDRNNDGNDSPQILNDLLNNNSVISDPFGIAFDYNDISQNSSNIANLPTNPILHGPAGNVTQVKWSGGTTISLNTTQNSSATGIVYKTGASNTGISNILCASSVYQNGKVVAFGDSSIADDGSGDSGDTLYDGYITDANGNHQKLLMNAIIWLATPNSLSVATSDSLDANFVIAPNPVEGRELKFTTSNIGNENIELSIFDTLGRIVKSVSLSPDTVSVSVNELKTGIYTCKVCSAEKTKTVRFVIP